MEKGVIETSVGVLARPKSTLRRISQERPIGWAIVVYLVVSLITTVAMTEPELFEVLGIADPGMPAMFVGSAIIGIVALVLMTAICHLLASVLGAKGSFGGLFSAFGFAALPGIFVAPAEVLGLLPVVGALLSGVGTFGVLVWSLVLTILAVRETYLVSTGRAILILLLPFVTLVVLSFFLVMVLMFPGR